MLAQDIFNVKGRIALVTGAATGLGERFAHILAANGAKVALMGRKQVALESVKHAIEQLGGQAFVVLGDVTHEADREKAFEQIEQQWGVVDILVNNAGIAPPEKILKLTQTQYREVMNTNLDAVFFMAQLCAQRLVHAQKQGNIINIASILSFSAQIAVSTYAISKAAVVQATRSMGLEWAHKGIYVNALAPGYIITNINREYLQTDKGESMLKSIPAARFGEPADLDGALLLLASPAARFMSGTTLVVDGGHLGVLGA
jgi:3-oxoacyl-[acyl-carrier protein] reductase